jgi:hypothetical protein
VVASNLRQARQLAIGTRTPHRVVFSVPEQDPQLDTLPQEIWIQTKRVAQGATNYTGSENWVDVTDPKRLPDGVRIMSFSGKEPGAPPSASEMYCAEFNFRGQMTKSYFLPERQVSSISLYVHLQRIGEEVDPNEEDHRLTVNSVEILRLTGRVRTYDYGYGSPFATTEYRG